MSKTLDCILLIDDNQADNYLHEMAIRESGCARQVVSETDAQRALDRIRQKTLQPDLILLDINMPGMDGWEFSEAYHNLPNDCKNGIMVMMLTTSLNPDDRKRAEQISDMKGFMSKPLTAEMCHDVVKNYFDD